ncbi:hypothetical protein WJX77_006940 [Trebouxia sp. C0004]
MTRKRAAANLSLFCAHTLKSSSLSASKEDLKGSLPFWLVVVMLRSQVVRLKDSGVPRSWQCYLATADASTVEYIRHRSSEAAALFGSNWNLLPDQLELCVRDEACCPALAWKELESIKNKAAAERAVPLRSTRLQPRRLKRREPS